MSLTCRRGCWCCRACRGRSAAPPLPGALEKSEMQIQNVYLLTCSRQQLNTLVCMIGCTFHAFQLKNDQLVASHLLHRLQFECSKKNKKNNKCENEGEASCQVQSAARWGVDGLLLLLTACAPSSLIKLKVAAGVTALSSLQRCNHATALACLLRSTRRAGCERCRRQRVTWWRR